jgi:hypothetical protein
MVSTKSVLAAGRLLLSSFSSAHNMDPSPRLCTYDYDKGEADICRAPAVEKRDPVPDYSYDYSSCMFWVTIVSFW